MPIDSAVLRSMLREDAIELLLGFVLILTGLVTMLAIGLLRRRAISLIWLAAFSVLYGFRLVVRTGAFRLYSDVSETAVEYADAAITYTVPIPLLLAVRALFPAWQRFWTWGALGLAAFAVCAIVSDAMLERPFSAEVPNNLIAIAFFIGVLAWILRPMPAPSRELKTIRLGVVVVSLTALADNLRGIEVLPFPGPDLEPFGFILLIACLGTVAVRRMLADSTRLVALNRELDIARRIQSSILPQSMPRIVGLTIAARYRPMTAVAGDFYDFLEIDGHRIGVLVADVSGHGVPAALIASMVKVALAAQRDHAESPAAVLAGMNATLCGRLAGQYVTAAYLFIDTHAGLIRYGAAGHPPMLRQARPAGTVNEIERTGILLGFIEKSDYLQLEHPLDAGDRFLLYTDGLIEASDGGDDFFGLDRLKSAFAEATAVQPDHAADLLLTTVDRWSGRPPDDDLTVVLVDWTGLASATR
jgi:sigma-B regulation protein RsbU (phosphoserine phosphatase)